MCLLLPARAAVERSPHMRARARKHTGYTRARAHACLHARTHILTPARPPARPRACTQACTHRSSLSTSTHTANPRQPGMCLHAHLCACTGARLCVRWCHTSMQAKAFQSTHTLTHDGHACLPTQPPACPLSQPAACVRTRAHAHAHERIAERMMRSSEATLPSSRRSSIPSTRACLRPRMRACMRSHNVAFCENRSTQAKLAHACSWAHASAPERMHARVHACSAGRRVLCEHDADGAPPLM